MTFCPTKSSQSNQSSNHSKKTTLTNKIDQANQVNRAEESMLWNTEVAKIKTSSFSCDFLPVKWCKRSTYRVGDFGQTQIRLQLQRERRRTRSELVPRELMEDHFSGGRSGSRRRHGRSGSLFRPIFAAKPNTNNRKNMLLWLKAHKTVTKRRQNDACMVIKQIIPINPYVDSAILSHDPNLTMKTPRKQYQKPAKRRRGKNEGGKSEEDSADESRFCYTAASKARRMCAWCGCVKRERRSNLPHLWSVCDLSYLLVISS